MSPDATPTSVAPAVGPPLPAGEEAGRLRAPRRLARPRPQGSADTSWAVFFYEGSWAVGRGDRGGEGGGRRDSRTGWKNWKQRSGTSRIGCPGSLGYVMPYSISRVLNRVMYKR